MTVLIFLIVLVVLILVHEFGHFIVAKKFGIRVDEFGIGFPPKAYGKKFGETEYTLNWLPIGGFVRIWGEDPTEEHLTGPGSERSFVSKSRYVQALVLVAGVAMNILLAFVLYTIGYMVGMPTALDTIDAGQIRDARLLVTAVLPEGPGAAILKPSDELVRIVRGADTLAAEDLTSTKAVVDFIAGSNGEEVTFTLVRRGEELIQTARPQQGVIAGDIGRYALGFSMSLVGVEQYGLIAALGHGAERTYYAFMDILLGLGDLVGRVVHGTADMSSIAGPVGMVGMVGDAVSLGFVWLLTFSAFISLNLAVINILPIPALDGGRLLFVIIESIIRQPLRPEITNRVNMVGFVALLALMAFITAHDVLKLFN